VEATHTGDLDGIPPTGRRVRVTGIAIALISSSSLQIVEEHANSDMLGLLKQIGVIPESVKAVPLIF
jgi:predicted ester cyclase